MASGAGLAAWMVLGGAKCATIANLAIRNGRVWPGTGAKVIEGGTVAFRDATIIAVGADDEVTLGPDTRIIDADGAFVMPGLIDTHVHVTEALLNEQPVVQGWLRGGVTTIRDTGTIWQGPALVRSLVARYAPAPRLIATGGLFTVPDGYPTSRGPAGVAGSMIVADVASAIQAVHNTLDAGAEFIKIAVENGRPGGTLHEDAGYPTLSLPQVRAIVDTAHRRAAPVTAHVTNEWELRRALDGAVDSLAHTPLDPIPADLLQRLVANRIPMTGTTNIWDGGPLTRQAQRNIKALVDAGGVVAMGTDFPFQGFASTPIDELLLMNGAGLSNEQVLLASTRDAAIACARGDIGTLEEGRMADVLIIDGDPLTRLDDLTKLRLVIHDGVEVI